MVATASRQPSFVPQRCEKYPLLSINPVWLKTDISGRMNGSFLFEISRLRVDCYRNNPLSTGSQRLSTQRYLVHQINLFPIAKFGCLLGSLALVMPAMICSFLSTQIISALRSRLATREADRPELPLGLEFDWLDLLGLDTFQQIIIRLDDQSIQVALFILIATILGGGLLIGFTTLLMGAAYNVLARITGGVALDLEPIE